MEIFTLFLSSIWKSLTGLFAAVAEFITKNPVLSAVIALMVVTNLATWHYTKKATKEEDAKHYGQVISNLEDKIRAYNDDIRKRNDKIAELEEESETLAITLEAERSNHKKKVAKITSSYEAELEKERAKAKTVSCKIPDPESSDPTQMKDISLQFEDGQLVCRRFYRTFQTKVNELADVANGKGDTK